MYHKTQDNSTQLTGDQRDLTWLFCLYSNVCIFPQIPINFAENKEGKSARILKEFVTPQRRGTRASVHKGRQKGSRKNF